MNLNNFVSWLGFVKIEQINPYGYDSNGYKSVKDIDGEKLLHHKEFLKYLLDEERSRLENIEGKTSQLVSQTSLIISLASLFIPLLIDKSNDINNACKLILVLILILTYLFYILTIINALKNYNLKKYKYAYPSPQNVLEFKDKPINDFHEEIIRDYLYSINENQKINNIKASNVLHSYNTFKIANILLSILVILVCLLSFFTKESSTKVEVKGPIHFNLTDPVELKNKGIGKPIYLIDKDTVYIEK